MGGMTESLLPTILRYHSLLPTIPTAVWLCAIYFKKIGLRILMDYYEYLGSLV